MRVCVLCTTNPHLKRWIEANGSVGPCSLCGSAGHPTADLTLFLAHIDCVIRRHYSPDRDEGEGALDLIARTAGISRDLARLVTEVIHDDEGPGHSFCDYGPLSFAGHWSHEHTDRWERLKEIVKHRARFLEPETRSILDSLLGGLETFCGGVTIRELRPADVVFRARLAGSYREADDWFKYPKANLNAPPEDKATAGRMNPAGVRAFYGAFQKRIAVAELRPPIGSHVVVGAFVPARSLRVLDLGVLGDVFEYEDLFGPHFDAVSTRLTFLRMLEQEISLPIQPHDQALEYIPTQVVAEYVRLVLGLDGVAYRSAQIGEAPTPGRVFGTGLRPDERNLVLLGAAATTTSENVAEGVQPGLTFVAGSQQMLDITKVEISYERNMWAHYDAAPDDEEEGA
jgi:hypothetical protein